MKPTLPAIFGLLCAAIILNSCKKEAAPVPAANHLNNTGETKPAIQTAVDADITENVGGFYKALPASYDLSTRRYPLLVFLHGANEVGNGRSDLSKLLGNALPKLLYQKNFPAAFTINGTAFSFIVISPQFRQWPQSADINAIIDYAIKNFRVDSSRIYIVGASMGGGAAWDYAVAYPNRIAAAVSISGASWPTPELCGNIARAHLPVWAFHNNDDATVAAGTTNTIVDYINSFNPGITAKKTIWPNGGHDAWTKATDPSTNACDGKNMYEWMLQYSRHALN
jgi:predicted peptidase